MATIRVTESRSLSDVRRNAKAVIEELRKSGRPQVLTVNGKVELVVQDAVSYQKLLDLLDRGEAIDGIRVGLTQMKEGRTKAAAKAFEGMRKKRRI